VDLVIPSYRRYVAQDERCVLGTVDHIRGARDFSVREVLAHLEVSPATHYPYSARRDP
jgi:hypothetical protein